MDDRWITLYSVARDGIGFAPWMLAAIWLGGIVLAGITLKRDRVGRLPLSLWLVGWSAMGGFGLGNVFYRFVTSRQALGAGDCAMVEGSIANLHRQDPMKKGDRERFVVAGREFSYSVANLGAGGMRSSAAFEPPLTDGLRVRVWHRDGTICRLDATPAPISPKE